MKVQITPTVTELFREDYPPRDPLTQGVSKRSAGLSRALIQGSKPLHRVGCPVCEVVVFGGVGRQIE